MSPNWQILSLKYVKSGAWGGGAFEDEDLPITPQVFGIKGIKPAMMVGFSSLYQ